MDNSEKFDEDAYIASIMSAAKLIDDDDDNNNNSELSDFEKDILSKYLVEIDAAEVAVAMRKSNVPVVTEEKILYRFPVAECSDDGGGYRFPVKGGDVIVKRQQDVKSVLPSVVNGGDIGTTRIPNEDQTTNVSTPTSSYLDERPISTQVFFIDHPEQNNQNPNNFNNNNHNNNNSQNHHNNNYHHHHQQPPQIDNNYNNNRGALRRNVSIWVGVTSCVWGLLLYLDKSYF